MSTAASAGWDQTTTPWRHTVKGNWIEARHSKSAPSDRLHLASLNIQRCHQLGTRCFEYMNHGGLFSVNLQQEASIPRLSHFPSVTLLHLFLWQMSNKEYFPDWKTSSWEIFSTVYHVYKKYKKKKEMCFFFMCFPLYTCMLHSHNTCRCQRRHQPPWNWSSRWLWATPCRSWEVNPGPLEEHPVLLTSKPSLQPLALFFFFNNLILWKNKINCLPFPNLLV